MWRVFATSCWLAGCGGSDGVVPDAAVEPADSPNLVGLVPLSLGSAYVRVDNGEFAVVARSDGDWLETAISQGGQLFGLRLLGEPFSAAPICVVSASEGQSSIVRTGACQLLSNPTESAIDIRCWDQVMNQGFDTHFTILCVGERNGTELTVRPTTPSGLRLGAAVLTEVQPDRQLGNFVAELSKRTVGDGSQNAEVVHATFDDAIFDDAPNCIANGTGSSSVELARLERTSIDVEPNVAPGTAVLPFHTLCLGEHGAPERIETTASHGAVVVGASIVGASTHSLGDWIESYSQPSTGLHRITVKPGALPTTPICVCSSVTPSPTFSRCTVEMVSGGEVVLRTLGESSAPLATDAQLICVAENS